MSGLARLRARAPKASRSLPPQDRRALVELRIIILDVRYLRGPGSAKSNGRDIFGP